MPAFVVLPDPGGGLKGGPAAWGSGFLPATYQGATMRPGTTPVLELEATAGCQSAAQQRSTLDFLRRMNERHLHQRDRDDELSARIEAYELAFRMQAAAPEVVDFSQETPRRCRCTASIEPTTREFGERCLLARRMIERGVRFVQVYSGDTNGWDAHKDVDKNHTEYCGKTDKPVAGLLKDLKRTRAA